MTEKIPDVIRPIDLWVDVETHSWMDTVAIRPMTNRGAKFIADLASCGDELDQTFAGTTKEEMRCSRKDFSNYIYEHLLEMGYGLNVRRASETND